MGNAVSPAVTLEVIETHLRAWRKELEGFRIALRVAEAIGDTDQRKDSIRIEALRCTKAVEELEKMLKELEEQK